MSPAKAKASSQQQQCGMVFHNRTPSGSRIGGGVEQQGAGRGGEHPVEVVGRIREHPDGPHRESAIRVNGSKVTVKAEHGNGSREFCLDGVSFAALESLQDFYEKYVESRVEDVKGGARCSIMMYGPTGAGKSYTMFGSAGQKGVAYHALQQLMRPAHVPIQDCVDEGVEVRASVWEIYNEEIYDLLSGAGSNKSGLGGLFKMSGGRMRLEVMGKKVKNSMYITGTDPQKLLQEISKVESRRVVKSTNCNDRSSRSHCMVTLDVPAVGGKLVLVDMAGSENVEQAGLGRELKMQTGKINQGNAALKRVVEAIANSDPYIPYRDSKLTMVLQESFEDEGTRILMVLCASPDSRDLHKTINTLEYGAKAKCIVRLPNSPMKGQAMPEIKKLEMLEARICHKDAYIDRLRRENESKMKENESKIRELEIELDAMKEKFMQQRHGMPLKIDLEVDDSRRIVHNDVELDARLNGGSRKKNIEDLEALVIQQQRELDMALIRAEKAEAELLHLQRSYSSGSKSYILGTQVASGAGDKAILQAESTAGFRADLSLAAPDNLIKQNHKTQKVCDSDAMVSGREVANVAAMSSTCIPFSSDADLLWQQSTAPENALTDSKESEGEECLHLTALNSRSSPLEFVSSLGTPVDSCSMDSVLGPSVIHGEGIGDAKPSDALPTWKVQHHNLSPQAHLREISPAFMVSPAEDKVFLEVSSRELESELVEKGLSESKDADAARRARINSIFLLCGDRREIAAKTYTSPLIQGHQTELAEELSSARFIGHLQSDSLAESLRHEKADQSISAFSTSPCLSETTSTDVSSLPSPLPAVSPQRFTSPGRLKRRFTESPYANENTPQPKHGKGKCDVYVKWETSKDPAGGKPICIVSTVKSASLAELREEVEAHIPIAKKNFAFLILGEVGAIPVDKDIEANVHVASLPDCLNNNSRLACLRPPLTHTLFVTPQRSGHPFRSLENQIPFASSQGNSPGSITTSTSNVKNSSKAGDISLSRNLALAQSNGLRTVMSNGVQPSFSLKEKASLAHVHDLSSKFIH
ncbi:unnamed protein product [Sphagnum troendelagicum]|uniref:Kinesin motor domain-containing protein n=1 Tax=Sphagnum troendelagicum TaxID=128251 RepID=A0ABP0TZ03_9BRYO